MDVDVAIIGSGPYGLSVAAHLAHHGIAVRMFGPPMDTWRNSMPVGMLLKSDGFASSLCAPVDGWTIGEYLEREGVPYSDRFEPRVLLEHFVEYGEAFQRELIPDVDHRHVTSLASEADGFSIVLDDGEEVTAGRVVVAVGITHYAYIPPDFRADNGRVTHTSEHRTFENFSGRRVAVIGAGSSAVAIAGGLIDAGADVHLLARRAEIPFWEAPDPSQPAPSLWQRLRYPTTGLGPGIRNQLCEKFPDVFRRLPQKLRLTIVRKHLGPSSGWWMRDKVLGSADVQTQTAVREIRHTDDEIVISTTDVHGVAAEVRVDHVICGTGYRADLGRLEFLDPALRDSIARVGLMPQLSRDFESSVPGLYFVGATAAGTFGPLLRFVVGGEFAAPRAAAHVVSQTSGRKAVSA